jgi:hypothetical protein
MRRNWGQFNRKVARELGSFNRGFRAGAAAAAARRAAAAVATRTPEENGKMEEDDDSTAASAAAAAATALALGKGAGARLGPRLALSPFPAADTLSLPSSAALVERATGNHGECAGRGETRSWSWANMKRQKTEAGTVVRAAEMEATAAGGSARETMANAQLASARKVLKGTKLVINRRRAVMAARTAAASSSSSSSGTEELEKLENLAAAAHEDLACVQQEAQETAAALAVAAEAARAAEEAELRPLQKRTAATAAAEAERAASAQAATAAERETRETVVAQALAAEAALRMLQERMPEELRRSFHNGHRKGLTVAAAAWRAMYNAKSGRGGGGGGGGGGSGGGGGIESVPAAAQIAAARAAQAAAEAAQAAAEAALGAQEKHSAEQARAVARMRVAQASAAPAAAAGPAGEPVRGGHLLNTDSALGGVVKVDGCAAARALLNACHSGAQFHSVIMFAGGDLDEGVLRAAKWWTWEGGATGRWLVGAGANEFRVETHVFNKEQGKYDRRVSSTTLEDCRSSTILVVRRHAPPSFGGRGWAFVLADAPTLAASLLLLPVKDRAKAQAALRKPLSDMGKGGLTLADAVGAAVLVRIAGLGGHQQQQQQQGEEAEWAEEEEQDTSMHKGKYRNAIQNVRDALSGSGGGSAFVREVVLLRARRLAPAAFVGAVLCADGQAKAVAARERWLSSSNDTPPGRNCGNCADNNDDNDGASGAKPSSLPQLHQPLAARVGLLYGESQLSMMQAVRRLSGSWTGAAELGQNASLSNRFVRSKAEHEMSQACNGEGAQGERFGDVSGWQGGEYKAELSAAPLGIAHVCTNETCFARLSEIRESPAARDGGFISTTSPLSGASKVRLWWSPLLPGEELRKRGVGPMALEKVHIGNIAQGSALAQYIARHGHEVSGLTEPQYKARMVELGFSNLFPKG